MLHALCTLKAYGCSAVIRKLVDHPHFLPFSAGDNHTGGSSREGAFKETVTLKWCTPRTNSVGR